MSLKPHCTLLVTLFMAGAAQADSVLLLYEDDVSREVIENRIRSFDLDVLQYWSAIHGGHIGVPCGEATRWVNVLSHVAGVKIAEHDRIAVGGNAPAAVIGENCTAQKAAVYDEEQQALIVPNVKRGNLDYRVELLPPFNIRVLELNN